MIEVFSRRNASNVLPVMWALGELDIAHVRHDVGGSFGGTREASYLAMNPNARIPTIKDGNFVLWESNAIVRYLCKRYDRGGLLLPASQEDYALADQWMDWLKTTLYPAYIELFWAVVRTEPVVRDAARIAAYKRATEDAMTILNQQLTKAGFVVGDRLTMADIPFGPLVYRYLNLDIDRPRYPHIETWHLRLLERPAFQKHVAFPFGRNPGEWYRLERESR
jgi:glutathione S-transferase